MVNNKKFQDELIEKIGLMLTGVTLDKKHSEDLNRIVAPVIVGYT